MNHISSSIADPGQTRLLAIHHHSQLTVALDGPEPDDEAIHGVTLTDISYEELMSTDAGQLIPGARVLVQVPLIGRREAEVRWIAGNRAGCRFAKPLALDEIRLATASSERLAGECPALARAIANMPPLERPLLSSDARAPAERKDVRWMGLVAFLTLAGAGFAAASWMLDHIG